MYKAFCDTCSAPLEATDNQIEIGQMAIVDKGQVFRTQGLHFCGGKTCISQWLDKKANRPLVVVPPSMSLVQ